MAAGVALTLDGAEPSSFESERDVARSLQARFAFLAEASRCLAESLDYEATLATVAGLSLPHLGGWCIVDVIDGDDEPWVEGASAMQDDEGHERTIRRLAVLHPDPEKQAQARELHERYPPAPADLVGAPRVIRTGRPEIMLDVPEAALEASAQDAEHLRLLRALGVRASLTVPMVARRRTVGAITYVAAVGERVYGDSDLLLAEDLARRCAMAIDNARLYRAAQDATVRAEEASRLAREASELATGANRAKAEFLAVMSHELRTPLNAIAGYTELLELGVRGPMNPAQLLDLQRIQRAQRHLSGLVAQVLGYARAEAGRDSCRLADVVVQEALLTAEVLVSPQIRARTLTCAWGTCDAGLAVRADRDWLHQILVNLLANAIKFTHPGGRLDVHCVARADAVEIRVQDSGIGIAPDKLEVIFQPFVQVGRRLNDPLPQEGVGLGLAISRELARRMNGDLLARSEEGAGSEFVLTLPRATPT